MSRGVAIFLEKSVYLTEEECELLEAQEKTGTPAMVGQVVRFMPEFRYLRKACRSVRLGALKSLSMKCLSGNVT